MQGMSRKRRGEDRDDVPFEKKVGFTRMDEMCIEGRFPNMFEYLVHIYDHHDNTRYLGVNCYNNQQRRFLEDANNRGILNVLTLRALSMLQNLSENMITFVSERMHHQQSPPFMNFIDEGVANRLTPVELPDDQNVTRGRDILIVLF